MFHWRKVDGVPCTFGIYITNSTCLDDVYHEKQNLGICEDENISTEDNKLAPCTPVHPSRPLYHEINNRSRSSVIDSKGLPVNVNDNDCRNNIQPSPPTTPVAWFIKRDRQVRRYSWQRSNCYFFNLDFFCRCIAGSDVSYKPSSPRIQRPQRSQSS
jgi:hypothetical protein